MEQARWAAGMNTWTLRGGSDGDEAAAVIDVPVAENVDTDSAPATEAREAPARDWAATLDLVQEASNAMRDNEARIAQLEAEAELQRVETHREMEALLAQLRLAQREIEHAYEQTAAAMARAVAAESWLEKLDDTIVNCFGRLSTAPRSRTT